MLLSTIILSLIPTGSFQSVCGLMIIVCLIRVLPFILFFRFGRFHFQISNVSLSLSLSRCMKFSITRAEIPTAPPPPHPPDTSVRRLHLLETFSLFYCVYHLRICTESLCFFFISFSTCSSPVQRVLCRVKGNCPEGKVAGASQNIMIIPPSSEKLILSWGEKKSKMQISQHHVHTV